MADRWTQRPGMMWFRQFMWSSWKFPLFANGVALLGGAVLAGYVLICSWRGQDGGELLVYPLVAVSSALYYAQPFWIIVMTVLCVRWRQWWHILRCWVGACGIGVGCALVVIPMQMYAFHADLYMLGVSLPEEKEYVAPRGLQFWAEDASPAESRAGELLNLRPGRPPVDVLVQMPPLPNLEKLTREAPEILREYVLRCLYAEATDPRFDAQVLCLGHDAVLLAHEGEPQSLILRTPDAVPIRRTHLPPKRSLPVEKKKEEASASWQMPLHSGWSVVLNRDYVYTDWLPAEEQVAGPLRRLDESLALLAANPARAGLDALLPPLPQEPFLCLWCAERAGNYRALVVLPPGYPDGVAELRAREVSTGKPVDCFGRVTSARSLDALGRAMIWHNLRVRSGSVNEFYATEWEIWFTPSEGGESRCVGKQEFLMMGGF